MQQQQVYDQLCRAVSLLTEIRGTLARTATADVGGTAYHVVYVTSTNSSDYDANQALNIISSPDSRGMCPFVSRGLYIFGLDTDVALHLSSRSDSGPWGPIFQVPNGVPFYLPISCMAHESVAVNGGGTYQLVFISKD